MMINSTTKLTYHFSIGEATKSDTANKLGINNAHDPVDLPAIRNAAMNMEKVRIALGDNPIAVNSWYRNEEVNKAVGGVRNSAHRLGHAVDFTCSGFGTVTDVCNAIIASGIEFDQLIWEYGRWVHISFAPAMRGQVLHIKKAGQYLHGIPK